MAPRDLPMRTGYGRIPYREGLQLGRARVGIVRTILASNEYPGHLSLYNEGDGENVHIGTSLTKALEIDGAREVVQLCCLQRKRLLLVSHKTDLYVVIEAAYTRGGITGGFLLYDASTSYRARHGYSGERGQRGSVWGCLPYRRSSQRPSPARIRGA